MQRKIVWIASGILVIAILATVLFSLRKPSFKGAVIDPPWSAAEIKLTDHYPRQFRVSEKSFFITEIKS